MTDRALTICTVDGLARGAWNVSARLLGGDPTPAAWQVQRVGLAPEVSHVALVEGRIVGTVFVYPTTAATTNLRLRCGLVTGLTVEPEFRGRGVALRLLRSAEQACSRAGLNILYGWFDHRPLAESAGFSHAATAYAGTAEPIHRAPDREPSTLRFEPYDLNRAPYVGRPRPQERQWVVLPSPSSERANFFDHATGQVPPLAIGSLSRSRSAPVAIISLLGRDLQERRVDAIRGGSDTDRRALVEALVLDREVHEFTHLRPDEVPPTVRFEPDSTHQLYARFLTERAEELRDWNAEVGFG